MGSPGSLGTTPWALQVRANSLLARRNSGVLKVHSLSAALSVIPSSLGEGKHGESCVFVFDVVTVPAGTPLGQEILAAGK